MVPPLARLLHRWLPLLIVGSLLPLVVSCVGPSDKFDAGNPFAPASPLARRVVAKWEYEIADIDLADYREPGARNALLYRLIFMSDYRFSRYEADLMMGKATRDSFIDLSMFGLNTAAAFVNPGTATQALAAIASGLGFTRNTVEKNFYMNHAAPVLLAKMHALRKEKLNEIVANMRLPSSKYPIELGIIDILEYHNRGTMLGALRAVSNDTSVQELRADGAEIIEKPAAPAIAVQLRKTAPIVLTEKPPTMSTSPLVSELRARRVALGSMVVVLRKQGNAARAQEILKAGGVTVDTDSAISRLGDVVDSIGSLSEVEKWEAAFGLKATGLIKTPPAEVNTPIESLLPTKDQTPIQKTKPAALDKKPDSL